MSDPIHEAIQRAARAAEANDLASAWQILGEHRAAITERLELAWAWLVLLGRDPAPPAEADVTSALVDAWPSHPDFVELLARTLTSKVDGRLGDEEIPPHDPALVAAAITTRCLGALSEAELSDPEVGGKLAMTLASALRLSGPRFDAEAERAFAQALATKPEHGPWIFNAGLFFKNRGRWAEALDHFRRARALGGDDQPTLWNLAIAATALGDGDAALEAWQALGFEARRGPDGLPVVDKLGRVKVRLSNRTVSTLSHGTGPIHEHVWVRPTSPCHGVVLSPTCEAVAADYGDVVLWDGAPIGLVVEQGREIPRFPMLARIAVGGVKKFRFRARQPSAGVASALNQLLPDAVWIYVFDEEVRYLCRDCVEGRGPHDPSHRGDAPKHTPHVVEGALVVEPESSAAEARALVEPLLAATADLTVAIPELFDAVGDATRSAEHRALWQRLDTPPA
ncbi:tetratricopeptide repeat protein [Myxococcota bacterium]|nr:tetratricopeptide repeat protein [Myxococcota bacterium]